METSPLQGPRCICKSHQGHKDGAPHAATWKLHTYLAPRVRQGKLGPSRHSKAGTEKSLPGD